MLVGVQLELRHVMWVFHGISQFCIVITFSTGLVIKISNDLLFFYDMVNFNKRRDSKGKRQAAHCGFGVKHLVGQAVGEAAKRLHLRLLRRHDRRWICLPFLILSSFSLFRWHLLGCIWMYIELKYMEHYGTLWNCFRCKHRSGLLKVNFDPALVRLLREAKGHMALYFFSHGFFHNKSSQKTAHCGTLNEVRFFLIYGLEAGHVAHHRTSHAVVLLYLQGARWSLDDLWHGWHLSNLDQPVGVHSSTVQFQLASIFRTRWDTCICTCHMDLSWKKHQETLSLR